MEKFISHTGIAAPLRISDVDTDQIVPGRFGIVIDKNYADAMMHDWRADPAFVLNQPAYRDATILIADENFGCGSSREMAVWALQGYGFTVILSPRFADIFRGNSLKNGLLTAELDRSVIEELWHSAETRPQEPMTVDLQRQQVRVAGRTYPFDFDANARWRLLNGLDDIDVTLTHLDDIVAYEAARRSTLPVTRRVTAGQVSGAH